MQTTSTNLQAYVGRFAPSPSGPLHFGSLVTALASFLDSRAHNGKWLVRIDDIDPPREQAGATDSILSALKQHGLDWDGDVLRQSTRTAAYKTAIDTLNIKNLSYPCACTRKQLDATHNIYNGQCRLHPPVSTHTALRVKLYDLPDPFEAINDTAYFIDAVQGAQQQNLAREVGDAIILRKDKLFAYQLAVAVDDSFQQITHVIRGYDLLDVTARQIRLIELFGHQPPIYGHTPVVISDNGKKLSKQNQAKAISNQEASKNLWRALAFLKQTPPQTLLSKSPHAIIEWAVAHWHLSSLHGLKAMPLNRHQ